MQLRTLVAIGLALTPLTHANAWTPFNPGITARLGPSLPKDSPAPASANEESSQSKSSTRAVVEKIDQSQGGLLNQQGLDVGNAKLNGKSTQTQSGALNKQERQVGVASDPAKADVTTKDLNQLQRGVLNNQKVHVGNAQQ